MYHHADNLFFGRLSDGSVRILKMPSEWRSEAMPTIDGVYPDAVLDVTINDGLWGSIVTSVSKEGQRWHEVMDIHHGRAPKSHPDPAVAE